MWNLMMGNSESSSSSSSSEEAEIDPDEVEKKRSETPKEKGEKSEKKRREEGDGQENVVAENKNLPKVFNLPSTNIKLKKLPPIKPDNYELPANIPSSPLVPMPVAPSSSLKPSQRKNIEPKFVPYEPYKAAITPLVVNDADDKTISLSTSKSDFKRAVRRRKKASTDSYKAKEASSFPKQDSLEANSGNLSPELNKRDEEIASLKKQLQDADRNLKIQLQINSEVKKLLVASVGEDIEARVDFLTQDKARLAADLRQYTSKISRDFEEKEKLSVESNLWKSKFLACSLIVDDLARWKAGLLQTKAEYEHNVRLLLHEHSVLWDTLSNTFLTLARLKSAFDPLEEPPKPAEAASLLGLADHALKTAEDLQARLLRDLKTSKCREVLQPLQINTPAEERLHEILGKPIGVVSTSSDNDLACSAVTGAARLHLKKLDDKMAAPRSEFKCCTHCQGSIHTI